ncbi:acyltransferase [Glutamicibacter nicotianae]
MTTLRGNQITEGSYANGNKIVGTPATNNHAVVTFMGSNCTVTFGIGSRLEGAVGLRNDTSQVSIGARSVFRGQMSLGKECEIILVDGLYCGYGAYLTTAEGASIRFGNDLLISDRFQARADDSHPLYDGITGARINQSQSIEVGDHVWIGADVVLLPGSSVGEGSVIGLRSMVTKSRPVPAHSLAVGSPVEVIREHIRWERKHLQVGTDIEDSIAPIFAENGQPLAHLL